VRRSDDPDSKPAGPRSSGTKLRVLLIEDSAADAALVLRELQRGGYEVDAERVQTAEELRASLSSGRDWDIVLADYFFPSLTGAAALSLLAGNPALPPLIVVSGTISDEAAVAAMRAGARDYVMKDNLRRLLPAIARELAEAGLRRDARAHEQRRTAELERLRDFLTTGKEINSLLLTLRNEPDLVQKACRMLKGLPGVDAVRVSLRGRQDPSLQTVISDGSGGEGLTHLSLPLSADGHDLGLMEVLSDQPGAFPPDMREFLEEVAGDIAIGIRSLRMARSLAENVLVLRKTLSEVIDVITSISECKDPYTAGHQRRVADLSYRIACEMALPGEDAERVATAARVHDIGKIGVPAEILAKPGRLTEPEMQLIRSHAATGREIMSSISLGWPLSDIIFQHHERLDGSGYPCGLRGDEIRLEARILAVADVVEAMSTHRPYRAALGVDAALAEIRRGKGTIYDGPVVEACDRVFTQQGFRFQ